MEIESLEEIMTEITGEIKETEIIGEDGMTVLQSRN
jgi:hypothetical protein